MCPHECRALRVSGTRKRAGVRGVLTLLPKQRDLGDVLVHIIAVASARSSDSARPVERRAPPARAFASNRGQQHGGNSRQSSAHASGLARACAKSYAARDVCFAFSLFVEHRARGSENTRRQRAIPREHTARDRLANRSNGSRILTPPIPGHMKRRSRDRAVNCNGGTIAAPRHLTLWIDPENPIHVRFDRCTESAHPVWFAFESGRHVAAVYGRERRNGAEIEPQFRPCDHHRQSERNGPRSGTLTRMNRSTLQRPTD